MSGQLDDTVTAPMSEDFASRFFVPSTEKVAASFGGASHVGKVRANNEDHFAIVHRLRSQHFELTNLPRENLPAFRQEAYLLIVADGIGGAAAGELASRFAMEAAWELSAQASSWVMKLHGLSDQQIRERIEAYALRMHESLLQAARDKPELAGMGTTWTSAYVTGWDCILAHIGDSRAYLFRAGEVIRLTRDHTLAQLLVDEGMKREQAAPFRHVVMNSLGGSSGDVIPDVDHVMLQSGDRLMLCTDGLSDLVTSPEIATILRTVPNPQDACDKLIESALDRGGKDNVTVIVTDVRTIDE